MKLSHTKFISWSIISFFAFTMTGCSLFGGKSVDYVSFTPNPVEFSSIGESVQINPRAFNSDGEELTDKSFTYLIENEDIASVTQEGRITSKKIGTTTISVECEEKVSFTQLYVCGCIEEIYQYNASDEITNITINNIACFPYLETVFETGSTDMEEAIANGAMEIDNLGRVSKLKYKTCN